MSEENTSLTVLGIEVFFKPSADMARVREAAQALEERYAVQKVRATGAQSKDILLTYVALGLADDVLQAQKELTEVRHRIDVLLSKIEGLT